MWRRPWPRRAGCRSAWCAARGRGGAAPPGRRGGRGGRGPGRGVAVRRRRPHHAVAGVAAVGQPGGHNRRAHLPPPAGARPALRLLRPAPGDPGPRPGLGGRLQDSAGDPGAPPAAARGRGGLPLHRPRRRPEQVVAAGDHRLPAPARASPRGPGLLMEFGLFLIPLLILVSGGGGYVGNLVGRNIGRRRLSLFGLRPRYTAQLITIATGMVITVVSVAAVLLVSRDARQALFQFRDLQTQLSTLHTEIKNAETRLKQLQQADIAYLRNQEVLRGVIDARLPLVQVADQVDTLRLRAVDLALAKGISVDGTTGSVLRLFPSALTWDQVADLVKQHPGETIVRIVANENTLVGEPLEVSVQLIDNRLVFKKGEVLGSGMVDGRRSRDEGGRQLLDLLDRAAPPPPFAPHSGPAAGGGRHPPPAGGGGGDPPGPPHRPGGRGRHARYVHNRLRHHRLPPADLTAARGIASRRGNLLPPTPPVDGGPSPAQ